MATLGPNAGLIGQPGSRARLCTPALVLDLDAFEHNVAAMARFCGERGVALRPHAKSHKSVAIARRQLEAGAIGISVATIGEAERLSDGGIGPLLITSPLVTTPKLERLAALHRRTRGLIVVADNVAAVDALAVAVEEAEEPLSVLVDLDMGRGRTGCADVAAARDLARRIAASDRLRFAGIQAYAGQLQHVADFEERRKAAALAARRVEDLVERLVADHLPPAIVSGAGTGTHAIDAKLAFTELQCGSYIFVDVDYARVALRADAAQPFAPALFVRSSVISANHPDHVTTDAGTKAFATDGPLPVIADGAPAGATYRFAGDEHGRVEMQDAARHLPVGTALECLTPHCDPTVNLYDHYHVVRDDTLIDIWPVDARGAF